MAKPNQKHLKWLRTLSTEEAWKRIVKDVTVGSTVDPEKFLKSLSAFHPCRILKIARKFVGGSTGCLRRSTWLSVEEARYCIFVATPLQLFKMSRS